jgi:hypothetical protein
MKQALNALEATSPNRRTFIAEGTYLEVRGKHESAIEALRAAIAQPVKYQTLRIDGHTINPALGKRLVDADNEFVAYLETQPESEPVAIFDVMVNENLGAVACGWKRIKSGTNLYTSHQVADYVPLSDGQVIHLLPDNMPSMYDGELLKFASAIERAVRGVE